MIIGILQTGYVAKPLAPKHGEYPAMFEKMLAGHGLSFRTYVVAENSFPYTVHDCDGWLITGSSDGAYESHAYIPVLEEFIRSAIAAEIPLVGICFGHQIMAQALGGKVVKFDRGMSVGLNRYRMDNTDRTLLAMHQDQVVEKPQTAEVIASSEFCAHAGLAYRGANGVQALSFQPHPEFSVEFMRDLIELNAGKNLSQERAAEAVSKLSDQHDSSWLAQQIAAFFLAADDKRKM